MNCSIYFESQDSRTYCLVVSPYGVTGVRSEVPTLMALKLVHTTAMRQKNPRGSPFMTTHIANLHGAHAIIAAVLNILNYNSRVAPSQLEFPDQTHFACAPSWDRLRVWCPKPRRPPCHTSCCGQHCHRRWRVQCTWRPGQVCIWYLPSLEVGPGLWNFWPIMVKDEDCQPYKCLQSRCHNNENWFRTVWSI